MLIVHLATGVRVHLCCPADVIHAKNKLSVSRLNCIKLEIINDIFQIVQNIVNHDIFCLKAHDPGSGRKIQAKWHGAGASYGVCISETSTKDAYFNYSICLAVWVHKCAVTCIHVDTMLIIMHIIS